jgi:hypothetical protein
VKPYFKSFILISFVFLLRTIYSCCGCNIETAKYSINALDINVIDNSNENYALNPDTVCRSAVAFEITLSETSTTKSSIKLSSIVGFSTVYAADCDCIPSYISEKKIDSISVISHNRLNQIYPPESLVTEQFVASSSLFPSKLYNTIPEIIEDFNNALVDSKEYRFYLFLKASVAIDTASFTIQVFLSDNSRFTFTVPEFYVKDCD